MIKELLYVFLLVIGFANGSLLVHLCKDEIKKWKTRFFIIAIITALASIGIYFTKIDYKMPVIITLLFMCITSLTIVFKEKMMRY